MRLCMQPVTSYGVLIGREGPSGPEFLLVQRRDSFSYVDIMRGKYDLGNLRALVRLLSGLTEEERARLLSEDPEDCLCMFWLCARGSVAAARPERQSSAAKLARLRGGYLLRRAGGEAVTRVTLAGLIADLPAPAPEPEWGVPKGRRNHGTETDARCAVRELREETGYPPESHVMLPGGRLWTEQFTGSNGMLYRHCYFGAALRPGWGDARPCPREIRDARWVTLAEACKLLCGNSRRLEIVLSIACELTPYLNRCAPGGWGVSSSGMWATARGASSLPARSAGVPA
jgi:8-oxo-dGTP pyrophosphatase MutT (NUDIX family)